MQLIIERQIPTRKAIAHHSTSRYLVFIYLHSLPTLYVDGQVRLVCSFRLQTDNFQLFLHHQMDKQQTSCFQIEQTINILGKLPKLLFSVFHLMSP
jgi:hypothetical protein